MITYIYNLCKLVFLSAVDLLFSLVDTVNSAIPALQISEYPVFWISVVNRFIALDYAVLLFSAFFAFYAGRYLIRLLYDLWEAVPLN